MSFKENIRSILQKVFSTFTSLNDDCNVLFPRHNYTLASVITSCINNNCRIFFVPQIKQDRFFDWRRFDVDDKGFLLSFAKLEQLALKYLRDNTIDYFVVDRMSRNDLWLHAILSACKKCYTEAIYLEHGETGSIHPDIELDRLLNYDYFYASNTDMKNHMQQQAKDKELYDCRIKEWKRSKFIPKKKQHKQQQILYAPQFIEADRFNQLFPQTLQYKHKESLVKEFHALEKKYDIRIVWKTYKQGNLLYDPIKDICNTFNIKYVDTDSFSYWLSKSTMFITDCISTTFYDAVDYGIPVLCLRYAKAAPIRQSILDNFGDSIFVYNTIEQAIDKMRQFVADCANITFLKQFYIRTYESNPDKFPWERKI